MKVSLFFVCLISSMMFAFSIPGFANQPVRVKGKILFSNGEVAAFVTVALKEIEMSNPPQIRLLLSTQTDETGSYEFGINPATLSQNNVFYRISTDLEGQSVGSDPFRLQTEMGTTNIDLSIPAIIEGLENITFVKEVVIIESINEAVHITNLIFIENGSGSVVNARKIPFRKKIPVNALNVTLLNRDKGMNVSSKQGEIAIEFSIPEGNHEVIFSYDVPVDNGEISLEHQLSYSIREVEFTTPDKSLEIYVDDSLLDSGSVLSERKKVGDREFFSQILKLTVNKETVPIVIKGIPVSQSRLFLPALLLFFVLIVGLVWYLVKISKSTGKPL